MLVVSMLSIQERFHNLTHVTYDLTNVIGSKLSLGVE